MAKEKFERTKPHVNFLDGVKAKLFGAPPVDDPPIEALAGPDVEPAADSGIGSWAKAEGLDVNLAPDEAGNDMRGFKSRSGHQLSEDDASEADGAADSLQSAGGPGEPPETVMFNPTEITINKTPPWSDASPSDEQPADGANELSLDDTAGGEAPHGAETVDNKETITIHGSQTEDMGGTEASSIASETAVAGESAGAGDSPDGGQQHNESDLAFLNQRLEEGDPDQPLVLGDVPDSGGAGTSAEPEGSVVTSFDQEETGRPYVIGQMWNGEDDAPEESSVLADLSPTENLVGMDPGVSFADLELPDADDVADLDD